MIRMKKIAIAALALVVSTTAHAQFESGKQYIGASMTGLNLSYNGSQDLNLGIQAKAGYFVEDDWMLLGQVEYNHSGLEGVKDYFSVGAQARYYIEQNGLYLGGGVKLAHSGRGRLCFLSRQVGYPRASYLLRSEFQEACRLFYRRFETGYWYLSLNC